jgi:hypothetical protein
VYQTAPSAETATSCGRDPDGTSYSRTTARSVAAGDGAEVPATGIVVTGAADVAALEDAVAGRDRADVDGDGPDAAPPSPPDEHASAVALNTNNVTNARRQDVTGITIGADVTSPGSR